MAACNMTYYKGIFRFCCCNRL